MNGEFTAAQRRAIESESDDILVAAGPGSGKTRTLVGRILRRIENGVNPRKIAVLTFTNAAARELETRLTRIDANTILCLAKKGTEQGQIVHLGKEIEEFHLGYCGTLHGFALRMLRDHGEGIGYGPRLAVVSAESAEALLLAKAKELRCKSGADKLTKAKAAHVANTSPRPATRMDEEDTVIAAYRAELWRGGVIDFDFLLRDFLNVTCSSEQFRADIADRFDEIYVDEVQDSSFTDWCIYQALPVRRKFYVGDPDQGIYSFRGGSVEQMVQHGLGGRINSLPTAELIELNENFRSRAEICAAANELISHNMHRFNRKIISAKGPGGFVAAAPPAANEGEELAQLAREIRAVQPGQSTAVLARTNDIAAKATKTLVAWNIPCLREERGKLPPDFKFARLLVELLANPDNDALARLYLIEDYKRLNSINALESANAQSLAARVAGKSINRHVIGLPYGIRAADVPSVLRERYATKESIMLVAEKLAELWDGADVLDLAAALAADPLPKQGPGDGQVPRPGENFVEVMTVHAAKGREFDNVFVIGFEDEVIPGRRKDADVEEERRLAFVAATRARNALVFFHATSRVTPWNAIERHTPSRFLAEMGITGEQKPAT